MYTITCDIVMTVAARSLCVRISEKKLVGTGETERKRMKKIIKYEIRVYIIIVIILSYIGKTREQQW